MTQAEVLKLSRLAEARNNLSRQTEFRRFLEKDQALYEGQQRLERAVRTREQLAAELAARLRLAAPGKLSKSLYDTTAIALNVTSDERSVAFGKSVELLGALTRVAEETLQSPDYPRKRGVGPCDRGTSAVSSSTQGDSNAAASGCQPEHVGVLPAASLSVGGVCTLQVTTADPAAVKPSDRRAATATVRDPRTECVASASRRGAQGKVGKRYSSDPMGDGPSARTKRKRARDHQQDQERLRHADGSFFTEEGQVALVMALSDTGGASSSAPAPAPTPSPTPTPSPMPQISLLVTVSARLAPSQHTLASSALSSTEAALADGSPDRFTAPRAQSERSEASVAARGGGYQENGRASSVWTTHSKQKRWSMLLSNHIGPKFGGVVAP